MNLWRKLAFLSGQVGIMMLARYFFQWIVRFTSTPVAAAVAEEPTRAEASLGGSAAVLPLAEAEQGALLDPIARLCGGGAESGAILTALFPIALFSTVLLLFRLFDGVTDPLAGGLSDWWVRRGRERRSLLWFSFWIAPVGLVLCFSPSGAMAPALRWALMGTGLVVFFVGYTLYCIPYWSLLSDYSRGEEGEQRVLSTLLGVGILLATGLGFILSPLLIEALGYQQSALTFALIALPLLALPYFAAPRSGAERSAPQEAGGEAQAGPEAGLSSLLAPLKNRRFLGLIALFCGSQMSLTMMTSAAPFIAEGLLGATKGDVALLMGPFLGSALLSFPLAPWISRRFGWERALLGAAGGLAVAYLLISGLGAALFGTPLQTAMVMFTLAGPFVAILLALEGEAISDCAAADDPGRVSTYWGVFNLLVKTMNGFALWVSGLIVARICPGLPDFWGAELIGEGRWVGAAAIRTMSLSAGLFLFAGALTYLFIRRRAERQRA